MSIKPSALKKGGCIGIISPAGPITKEHLLDFEASLLKLKKLGYKIVLGRYAYNNCGYLAGTDNQRASDVVNMFRNKAIDAIFCSRGGYGSERIINYIDLELIKNNPKIFVGYSNITFLLNIFYQTCGFITFHGPMVKDFSHDDTNCNLNNMLATITSMKNLYEIHSINSSKHKNLISDKVRGILVGGNLCTLISTLGTNYEIDTKDKILFIEDIDESAYSVDRMLTQLKNAGKLDTCAGFIIGEFTKCEDSSGRTVNDVIRNILKPLAKPIIYNTQAGHGIFNVTLPIGAEIEMNPKNNMITVLESVVR